MSMTLGATFPRVHRRFGIAWSSDSSATDKLAEDPSDPKRTVRKTARTFAGSAST